MIMKIFIVSSLMMALYRFFSLTVTQTRMQKNAEEKLRKPSKTTQSSQFIRLVEIFILLSCIQWTFGLFVSISWFLFPRTKGFTHKTLRLIPDLTEYLMKFSFFAGSE